MTDAEDKATCEEIKNYILKFGSLATLAGAVFAYKLRGYKWRAPVPPILANTFVVPFVLLYAYGICPLWFSFLTVSAGELLSCGLLGVLLLLTLEKYKTHIFGN